MFTLPGWVLPMPFSSGSSSVFLWFMLRWWQRTPPLKVRAQHYREFEDKTWRSQNVCGRRRGRGGWGEGSGVEGRMGEMSNSFHISGHKKSLLAWETRHHWQWTVQRWQRCKIWSCLTIWSPMTSSAGHVLWWLLLPESYPHSRI